MTSLVAWLDTDDEEGGRMRELIAMFRDQGAVDELGMGRIRDAFSHRLFPGTSVLWSRARYLLFVPWIYHALEDGGGAPGSAEDRARKLQKRLARSLNTRHGAGSGVIGASGADVRQPPDLILWAALGDWDIRLDPGRMSQVREECVARSVRRTDLEGEVDHGAGLWHPRVNRLRPAGFPDQVGLELGDAEAVFLADLLVSPDALPGTFDTSWDLIVRFDEAAQGEPLGRSAAETLRALDGLSPSRKDAAPALGGRSSGQPSTIDATAATNRSARATISAACAADANTAA